MVCLNRYHRKSKSLPRKKELLIINISILLSDASFLRFAMDLDAELSKNSQKNGCPNCGGKLHFARYERKGRFLKGVPVENWNNFHSLCCSQEGCRKRVRPYSVRFAGRSPHNSGLVLLARLVISRGSGRSLHKISKELQVSERTLRRWARFWNCVHKKSVWWRKIASVWNLSGKTLNVLWDSIFKLKKNLKNSFEYLLLQSAKLWHEIKFIDGDYFPAKDA